MSLQHLDIVAEKNLEKYEKFLTDRRRHYYEIHEKCWYLDRRMMLREERRNAERAHLSTLQQKLKDTQERLAAVTSSETTNK